MLNAGPPAYEEAPVDFSGFTILISGSTTITTQRSRVTRSRNMKSRTSINDLRELHDGFDTRQLPAPLAQL